MENTNPIAVGLRINSATSSMKNDIQTTHIACCYVRQIKAFEPVMVVVLQRKKIPDFVSATNCLRQQHHTPGKEVRSNRRPRGGPNDGTYIIHHSASPTGPGALCFWLVHDVTRCEINGRSIQTFQALAFKFGITLDRRPVEDTRNHTPKAVACESLIKSERKIKRCMVHGVVDMHLLSGGSIVIARGLYVALDHIFQGIIRRRRSG